MTAKSVLMRPQGLVPAVCSPFATPLFKPSECRHIGGGIWPNRHS